MPPFNYTIRLIMAKHLTHCFSKRLQTLFFASLAASAALADTGDVVFNETFDTQEAYNAWTVIDANANDRTWQYWKQKAAYMYDYQGKLDGDDWIISPEITLDADKVYELKFYLAAGGRNKVENVKVFLGTDATKEAMTTELANYESLSYSESGDKTVKLYVPTTGTYRIAFYCYSSYTEGMRAEVDNISISEVSQKGVPAAVSDLTLAPGAKGALSGTLSFSAPSLTADGATLGDEMSISIYRNGGEEAVKTFTSVAAGSALTWTDEAPEHGFNTYKIVTSNDKGTGESAEVRDFIGVDSPNAVTDFKAKLNSERGISLTWTAPTASVNGGYVDFENLKYQVYRGETALGSPISATSFTDANPVESGQAAVSYKVEAIGSEMVSEAVRSVDVVTGEPLALPYAESFKNQKYTVVDWTQDTDLKDFSWSLLPDDEDGEYEEVVSQDGDNGVLCASSRYAYEGAQSRIISPLFDLSSVANPVMTFYFYYGRSTWYDEDMDGSINDNIKIQLSQDAGEWQDVENATFYMNDKSTGWTKCEVSLPQQKGYFSRIGILATSDNQGSSRKCLYVDNITIDESAYANDLALDAFTASAKRVSIGETTTYTATVYNRGGSETADYSVKLYCDEQLAATLEGISVEPAKKVTLTCETVATLDDAQADEHQWYAEIVYAADELQTNNTSEVLTTSVRRPDLPAIDGLTGEMVSDYVTLSWPAASSVEPVAYGEPLSVTETWDTYEPFLISGFGDWTVYDGDGATTLSSPRIPNAYDHRGEPMAFQVFNNVEAGTWVEDNYDDPFEAYSGNQYLACPSVDYPYENDDWIISPRLDGRAQTVKFYAKSTTYDPEWINTWVSTTDNHHDSFTQVSAEDHIALWNEFWKEYTIDIPEGGRYFAIHCSRRCNFLFIDDITYNAYNGQTDGLTLRGYNVYRDGQLLNASPISSPSFKDANVADGERHTYTVTAVYAEGESDYSNAFMIDVATGIEGIGNTSNAAETLRYNAAGQTIGQPMRGLNIVRQADGTTRKVMVK